MSEIAPLSPQVIEQLCAGEVVERPASVVKELVENSIDAGATEITIELRDGGRAGVTVTDNGAGIKYEQLPLAVKPHYTSKLQTLNDLYNLKTLGFRGEALGAISAVARVHITSRTAADPTAGELYVEAGAIQYHRPAAFNIGTRIEVRDLFFNVPVRRKFLKAKRTEAAQAIARIIDYSILYPNLAFKLLNENVIEYQTMGSGNLKEILAKHFGEAIVEELLEFDCEVNGYRAYGFISAPHLHLTHRNFQKIYINQRPARNNVVTKAITDSTVEFMTPGKYPYLCLFLTVPPDMIDVNIHPTKAEVALSDTNAVYNVISTALKKALDTRLVGKIGKVVVKQLPEKAASDSLTAPLELKPTNINVVKRIEFQPASTPENQTVAHIDTYVATGAPNSTQRPPESSSLSASKPLVDSAIEHPQPQLSIESSATLSAKPSDESLAAERQALEVIRHTELKVLGQISNTYIVFIAGQDLFLIDQHAAHERILFSKLWNDYQSGKLTQTSQALMFPYLLSISPELGPVIKDLQPLMTKLGFEISLGAANTVLVKSIPHLLAAEITENTVLETLVEVANEYHKGLGTATLPDAITHRVKLICSTLACKAALKAGTPLNLAQQQALLEELIALDVGTTCPHGRPVLVTISEQEISKLFLRS